MANNSQPSPVGNGGAIVADRNRGAAQSETFGDGANLRLGGEAGALRAARANASKQATSISGRFPERDKAHLRRAVGRIGGRSRASSDATAVQVDLVERLPMHLAEERTVLRLDMGEKVPATHRMAEETARR